MQLYLRNTLRLASFERKVLDQMTVEVLSNCPSFSWERANFLPSSCCVLDLVFEEC